MCKDLKTKKGFKNWFIVRVLCCMFYNLSPAKQIAFPVLFVFDIGSIVLTVIFVILWFRIGFDIASFEAMSTALMIVLFSNFCEAFFETYENYEKNN